MTIFFIKNFFWNFFLENCALENVLVIFWNFLILVFLLIFCNTFEFFGNYFGIFWKLFLDFLGKILFCKTIFWNFFFGKFCLGKLFLVIFWKFFCGIFLVFLEFFVIFSLKNCALENVLVIFLEVFLDFYLFFCKVLLGLFGIF